MTEYINIYKEELLTNVLPFWIKNSKDEVNGGYFTCLDREGKVFDTDKFIWLQNRQVWTFANFYSKIERNHDWLEMAVHGADFLEKYGRAPDGNWYFALSKEGKPLVKPYNIFSDCFAAMAFAALYRATDEKKYAGISKTTFFNILDRQHNPKGEYSKLIAENRQLKNFALPMILSNLSLELENILDPSLVNELTKGIVEDILGGFYSTEFGVILENVNSDGSFSDTFDGRLFNPGHNLEAIWFMLDIAERNDDQVLIQNLVSIALSVIKKGWDEQYQGIYYFLDLKGAPPQQLEWDQKLWWVHLEAMVCMIKAYRLTGNAACKEWFLRLHQYSWQHFRDPEFGEWFGYLNRRGEVLLNLKGGKWKGCFHVPRALYQIYNTLESIRREESLTL